MKNKNGNKDKSKKKGILYGILLIIGLLAFILELFVFQKPDGILGFLICIVSIYLILGSIIKLCILSRKFENALINFLDAIMWLP